jgi:hypothetical protein
MEKDYFLDPGDTGNTAEFGICLHGKISREQNFFKHFSPHQHCSLIQQATMVTGECPESNQYILLAIYNPMGDESALLFTSLSIMLQPPHLRITCTIPGSGIRPDFAVRKIYPIE